MGLLERIRRAGWWAWLCRAKWRTMAEARGQVIAEQEDRLQLLRETSACVSDNLRTERELETQRRMKWLDALIAIRQVHDGQGMTLAGLLEAHGLVGCRLDALAGEICPVVVGGNAAAERAEPADPALQGYTVAGEASDFWQVGTEAATLRWERVRNGAAGGVKVVVVARGWKTVEIPVSAQMALGLIEFLRRAREAAKAGGPGASAEKRDPIDRIDQTDGKSPP